MDFMKAMYVLWPDRDYIDKAVDSGIDTFLIAFYDARPESDRYNGSFGSYENNVKTLQYIRNTHKHVKVIPVVNWVACNLEIPQSEQFFDGTRYFKHTPCPASHWYPKYLLENILDLYRDGLCDGIFLDYEDYGHKIDSEVLNYRGEEREPYTCKCKRCIDYNEEQQRQTAGKIIIKTLDEVGIKGHLPMADPYMAMFKSEKIWWMNEHTYKHRIWIWHCLWDILAVLRKYKKKGATAFNSSGFWIEHYSASQYLRILKKSIKSPLNQGYWMYPQMRMSKFCPWRTDLDSSWSKKSREDFKTGDLIDSNEKYCDPEFFTKLKKLNNRVIKYRNGWWFNIKRKLVMWFIR